MPHYSRYVAIGDSSTEGIDDPDGNGSYRGWANRLAERVACAQGELLYANLGIRGRRTRRILEEQLEPALRMQPDLSTLFCGTNDVVSRDFDVESVGQDIETMQCALIESGATLLTFTLPDLTEVMPFGRKIAPRVHALNEALRSISQTTGTILVDFATYPVALDLRLWSADRFHANSAGHERIASALAHALGIAGTDASWSDPLPPQLAPSLGQRLAAEAAWVRSFLLPWIWRHSRGRSSGDGIEPKRPELSPVSLPRSP